MTFLEKLKEFIAMLGLLPLAKLLLTKPLYLIHSYFFKKSSLSCLKLVHEAIKESSLNCWIEFGTFLGAYRNNRIISHDLDIDFATDDTERFERFEKILISKGFSLHRALYLKSNNTLVEKSYQYNGANVDFFFVFKENNQFNTYDFTSEDRLTWGETINKYGGLLAFKNSMSPFTLDTISLHGFVFKCPAKEFAQLHLSELYGSDFIVPNTKWKLVSRTIRMRINDFGVLKNK